MLFSSLALSKPILDAITKKGYENPSPIQAQAIPPILEGRDVMAAAQTGTGKTAGFTLPILERLSEGEAANSNQVRALVLTPTRELAAQVEDSVKTYGAGLHLRSAVVFGGVKINPQMMKLRKGVDILVATPGRLLDLYQQNAVKFDQLEVLVLDEADRMLDMGFIHDIKKILKALPAKRQNLLFSATFSDDIRTLAKGLVKNPVEISVTPRNATAATVKQKLHPVDKSKKSALLAWLIGDNNWSQVLVFSRTKHGANRLTRFLEESGIRAVAIHGNKSQGARTKALAEFKANKVRVLVATDIAARGLDISQLPHVVNFDLPNVPEDYVHRIGRTGRAGASGEAVSLVSADEIKQLSDIERLIKKLIPREYVDGFEPKHELPESKLNAKVSAPKKPKKPKNPRHSAQNSKEKSAKDGGNKSRRGGQDKSSSAPSKPSATKRRRPRAGAKVATSRGAAPKKTS
ncbi:MAG: DEAD/DEAH box helicase [Agarilytica sp.]